MADSTNNPSWFSHNAGWVVPTAVSAIGNIFGVAESRRQQGINFDQTQQLMEMQNGFNVDMWHRNNDYNSPLHQLRMLQQAGLNPNIYGNNYTPASPQSSEVTSAQGTAPYNTQSSQLISNGTNQISNYLSQMLMQKKMRTELTGLNIQNKMLEDEYNAKSKRKPNRRNFTSTDEDGNINFDIYPDTNYWEELRDNERTNFDRNALGFDIDNVNYERASHELEVYEASMPYLKKMSHWQLRMLKADVRNKTLNNTLLEPDVQFAKKYGISSNDDGWRAMLKIALINPDGFNRIIDGLINAGTRTVTHQWSRLKHLVNSIFE